MDKLVNNAVLELLELPISFEAKCILFVVINVVAFVCAWTISPGGRFGSEIHWIVRIIVHIVLCTVSYKVIVFMIWINNYIYYISSVIMLLLIVTLIILICCALCMMGKKLLIKYHK